MRTRPLFLLTAAALAAGCGPNIEKDCETICEKLVECGVVGYTDVKACQNNCEIDAEDSDKCADSNAAFAKCVDGKDCSTASCASEESDVVNDCFK